MYIHNIYNICMYMYMYMYIYIYVNEVGKKQLNFYYLRFHVKQSSGKSVFYMKL